MMSDYYEERRREKRESAEQAREDKKLAAELQRQAEADRADQVRRDKREAEGRTRRERAERAQRRAAQVAAARGWLAAEADTAFSVALILLAVIPAISSQVGALTGKTDPGSAAALALMLELGAWSATVGASRAMKDGRPVTPYRVAMWGCAAVAAAINISHNGGFTDWFGLVMGAASIAGVAFWELRCVGRHGQSRRTKEERAEDKQRKLHTKERKRLHPDLWSTAAVILADAEYGALTQEQAWAMARQIHRGTTEAGLTPALVALRAQSRKSMVDAAALDTDSDPLFPDTLPDALLAEFTGTYGSMYRSPLGTTTDGDDNPGGTPAAVAPKAPSGGPSDTPGALGRKGKRASGRTAGKTPQKAVSETDIAKALTLARALGSVSKLSTANVRDAIGGGANEYAIRVRKAAVQRGL
ncbi:DUF2637 domain-containing protein (plasmid) [Kitasatospora sp. NBC_01246]|uniref:DUF2637 domain-containing protein n=1 Tax=Kitasatospora sp. NBC_01246 TaxID=2903570 RepID=UPI002E3251C9|nr:DUF2637 domain-containing protein [Kitasatospora sp. NBC_01246]